MKRHRKAVDKRHRQQILDIGARSEGLRRRHGVGNLVVVGHVELHNRLADCAENGACKGVHAGGVAEDVDNQTGKEADNHHPVAVERERKAHDDVDKHKRSGEIEDADVVAHEHLHDGKQHKQRQCLEDAFIHCRFLLPVQVASARLPSCS